MKRNYYILFILIIAAVSRVILLDKCPEGIHADEAFSGYEAWSLLHYGIDSAGYANPVYLTVWGGGMSILNSVLMIPFIALFGLNAVTVKIPVIIMGVVSVYVFYLLLKEVADEKTALWGSGLLAISPWHIMISRYGMDANLCPAFVLIAMYLTVLGIKDNKRFKWAAVAWGVALYSYVVLWIFVPIFLLMTFLYCLRYKKIKDWGQFFMAGIILAVIAMPLIVFICVNMDIFPEIRTSVISIPKLVGFRTDELGVGGYWLNIKRIIKCFILQYDGYLWNSIPIFGVYYIFSTPISIVGFVIVVKRAIFNYKNKEFGYEMILLIWLISALIMAFTQTTGTNLTRINPINPAMFIFVAVGIRYIVDKIKYRKAEMVMVGIYILAFMCFLVTYFTVYRNKIAELQLTGAKNALKYAEELYETGAYGEKIYIAGSLRHSQVLFYTKFPTNEYIETVEYNSIDNGVYNVKGFGNFEWFDLSQNDFDKRRAVYVIPMDKADLYDGSEWEMQIFDKYAVVVPHY